MLVHLVTFFFQGFVVFIYGWFFIAVVFFQADCYISGRNCFSDHFLHFLGVQCGSFFFRLDLIRLTSVFNACIYRFLHLVFLHTFQFFYGFCQLVLIFISGICCQCIFFLLIKCKEPFITVLLFDQFPGSAIRFVDQTCFFCGNALFSVVSCFHSKDICLHFFCKKFLSFVCSFIGAVKTVYL